MIVLRKVPGRPLRWRSPAAAIGIFDGVHRGHRRILEKAVRRARALKGTPVAVTFHPHPTTVLAPEFVPTPLLSLGQRLAVFERLGIRSAVVLPFTRRFSRWSPRRFVEKILVRAIGAREVVVGHDFGFGAKRAGTVETLRAFGKEFGFKVHVIPPVYQGGSRISSRRLRKMIAAGRLEQAAAWLGRPPSVVGKVLHGAGRGASLGFPTANLRVEAGVLPPVGVYVVSATLAGKWYEGMANIGFRPTFEGVRPFLKKRGLTPLLEIHLFNLRNPIYGKRLEILFLKRLRQERRFPSASTLQAQLKADARRARQVLALHPGWRMVR